MIVFFISFLFFFIFIVLNLFLCKLFFSKMKLDSFECGFDSLGSNQLSFSVHFFLIMLIFIVFDLELVVFISFIVLDVGFLLVFYLIFFFVFLSFFMELSFKKLLWVV